MGNKNTYNPHLSNSYLKYNFGDDDDDDNGDVDDVNDDHTNGNYHRDIDNKKMIIQWWNHIFYIFAICAQTFFFRKDFMLDLISWNKL